MEHINYRRQNPPTTALRHYLPSSSQGSCVSGCHSLWVLYVQIEQVGLIACANLTMSGDISVRFRELGVTSKVPVCGRDCKYAKKWSWKSFSKWSWRKLLCKVCKHHSLPEPSLQTCFACSTETENPREFAYYHLDCNVLQI